MGASILGLAKSIYYTFQAFEENSFTIISKKSESSSIMKVRRLQNWAAVLKAQELASIGQWWETLNSWWTCSSWSVPETSSWLDSRRNSEFENLKMELVFFRRCHRWAGQCVWYGRIHVYRREWSHSCWCRKLPFAFFSALLFLIGFIVIVKRLYASVACDFDNIWAFNVCFLQLADCCLSCTVICELFVTFFKYPPQSFSSCC